MGNRISKHMVEDLYALTPVQQGMLFHYLKNPDSGEYLEQLSFRLKGAICIETVNKAWAYVAVCNEALRTVFRWDKLELPVQIVLRDFEVPINIVSLKEKGEDEAEQLLNEILEEDYSRGVDISQNPFRITLVEMPKNVFEMIITNHHILLDGWSNGIIIKEFIEAYESIRNGKELITKNKMKIKEFIMWLQKLNREEQSDYWNRYLKGYEQRAAVPVYTGSRPHTRGFLEYSAIIDSCLTDGIKKVCQQAQVTEATFINTAWGILLHKYNNTRDAVFGTTISGRNAKIAGIEEAVGLYINTLPLRIRAEAYERTEDVLKRIEKEIREREGYENIPLVEIQGISETGTGENLFDTLLVIENYPIDQMLKQNNRSFDLEINRVKEATNYDVTVGVMLGESVGLTVIYRGSKYTPDSIERLTKHFMNILRQMAENSQGTIGEIKTVSEEEEHQLIYDFNNTGTDYPKDKTVYGLFEKQAEQTPEQIALVYGNERLTYKELNKRANQLAWHLKNKGVRPDEIVGVMQERSIEMMVSILGVLKAGAAYLPIDPGYPTKRIMAMLENSDTRILLTKENTIESYPFTSLQNIKAEKESCKLSSMRVQIKDLDKLPFPDRTLVDYEKYSEFIGQAMVKNAIAIQATRGCPFKCAYCHKLWPKSHIVRSAENIFEEVLLYYRIGVRRFVFVDDIFNLNAENSERFFRLIIRNKLKIQIFFPQGLRGDILTKEYIDLMVEAGVVSMALALETASPRLQRLIGKNLNLKKLKENIDYICDRHPGLILELFTMHGFPTETEEEANMTLDFIKSIKWLHFPYIHILKIYPETDMARIAMENGVSREVIERSVDTAYHEFAETVPFSYEFTKRYQTEFLTDYFLNKERLLKILPRQMKILTESELVQKYNSYLPWDIKSLKDFLSYAGIEESELGASACVDEDFFRVAGLNKEIQKLFPAKKAGENALRILFLDLSQYFTKESSAMLYDVVEPPLGLMYLLTYLNECFEDRIDGKIAKARIDFNSFHDLKQLIDDYKPDVIGVRSLTYYRNFFHKTIALIRQWGFKSPIITGGPYATSSCSAVLNDRNIDMVILGEGEITLREVIQCMMDNGGRLPDNNTLLKIPGIAVSEKRDKPEIRSGYRDIMMIDHCNNILAKEAFENPEVEIASNNTVYQIYTSGSTGTPKGAMVKHHSFTNLVNWYTREFDINNEHRILLIASISFDLAQKNLYATLVKGGQLHLFASDSYDYDKMSEVIEKEGITVINCTPSAFYPLLDTNEDNAYSRLRSLRFVFLGGEPINMEKLLPWMKASDYHCEVVNTYGPTECTDVISYYRIGNEDYGSSISVPIGKPIDNARLYVLDNDYGIMPVGVDGELYAGGICVGKGYYKDDALTRDRFIEVDNLPDKLIYKTGDIVKRLPDGNIEFVGRADNQVKIRGFRIETGEIESKLLKHKAVKEAIAIVHEAADKGKYICAYLVSDQAIETNEITAFLENELPSYMIPSFFIKMENLPLTPSGKVDRKALPDPLDAYSINGSFEAPGSEMENTLAEIWRKVLNIDNISVEDNFFEIGGHSIKAVEVINKVHKLLNIKITVEDLFSHPTIRGLSKLIEGKSPSVYKEIQQQADQKYYDLSYGQKRLWVLNRLNPQSTAYNIQGSFELNERVDRSTVEKVMNTLAARHEGLRTRFMMKDDEPVQIIEKKVSIEVPLLSSENDREQIIEQLAGTVFNLEKAPLLSVRLLELDKEKYELLFCMHHIISDGWSMEILKKDFLDIYEACKEDRDTSLKPLRIQYKDYAAWQNNILRDTSKMDKAKAYWKSKLTDAIPEIYIAGDRLYSENSSRNSAAYRWMVDEKCLKALKDVAVRYRTSLFNVLFTAYAVMLADLSDQKDMVIGIAGTAREHEDLREVIGFFVNTIIVRSTIDVSATFSNQLKDMHREVMSALEYQTCPLELITQELKMKFPAIRMFFNMLNIGNSMGAFIAPFTPQHIDKVQDCKFDVVLYVTEYANGLEIRCDYLTGMYSKETIVYLMERYKQNLMAVSEDAGSIILAKSGSKKKRSLRRLKNTEALEI